MSNIPMVLMNGLTYAGLLFMCASGFTLIFGLMRVVNMSHGVFYLIGAYIGSVVMRYTGNWYLALIVGALVVAGIAILFKVSLLDRVIGNDQQETLLTLGLNFVVCDVLLAIFGGIPQSITAPKAVSTAVNLGFIQYPGTRLFILVSAVVVMLLLGLLIFKTKLGQTIRAGVDDRTMVGALGVNIKMMFTVVFALGGLLVGLSGVLGGSYLAFTSGTDMTILTYSLVVVILGGMGSLAGAATGALIVGMLDSVVKYFAPNMSMLAIFGVLIIVLAFRPRGILGKER